MSEIEKLYKNAEIEPKYQDCCKLDDKYWDNENLADKYVCFDRYMKAVCPHNQECTDECKNAYNKTIYPEFTAEKQLELIKLLVKKTYRNYFLIKFSFKTDLYQIECDMSDSKRHYKFSETLASMINVLWQDLSETEKAEIKRILE